MQELYFINFLYYNVRIVKDFEIPMKIAFIGAHPDDETLISGLLRNNKKLGGKNYIFCATKGGKGSVTPQLSKKINKNLTNIREEEYQNSCNFLGVEKNHRIILNYEDGKMYFLGRKLEKELEKHIEKFLIKARADVVISFRKEDGFTGHTDHIKIAEITYKVVKKIGLRAIAVVPPPFKICPEFYKSLKNKRTHANYIDNPDFIEPNIHFGKIPKSEKLASMKIHKSQPSIIPHYFLPNDEAEYFLKNEYFYEG